MKQTGLGAVISVDDMSGTPQDISQDVESYDVDDSAAALDYTGVDATVDEVLVGRSKSQVTLNLLFDPGSNMAHDVFRQGKGIARSVSITQKDATGATSATYTNEMLHLGYKVSRAANGKMSAPVVLVQSPGSTGSWA